MSAEQDRSDWSKWPAATLGAALRNGYSISLHCEVCQHSGKIDLAAMVERFGASHSAGRDALLPLLRCGHCGFRAWRKDSLGRGVAVSLGAPGTEGQFPTSHLTDPAGFWRAKKEST